MNVVNGEFLLSDNCYSQVYIVNMAWGYAGKRQHELQIFHWCHPFQHYETVEIRPVRCSPRTSSPLERIIQNIPRLGSPSPPWKTKHTQLAGPTRTICWWSLRTNAHKNCQLQYLSNSTLDLITPCLLRFPPSTELATCPASHNTPPIQIEKYTLKPSAKVLSPNLGFSMFSMCFPYVFHIFPSFSRWISTPSGHLCALTLSRCSQEVMSSASPRPTPWKKVASSCQRSLASSGRWGGNFLVKNGEKWWIYLISPSKNGGNHGFHMISTMENWWINQTSFKFHAFHGFHCSKDGCQGTSQRETIASTGQNLKGFRFQFSYHAILWYRNQ